MKLFPIFAIVSTCAAEYSAHLCGNDRYTSPDGAFTYGSNAWNPSGGFQCISIDDSVPALDATWQWDDGSNVHSFPHVRFEAGLPVKMAGITALRGRVNWTMGMDGHDSTQMETSGPRTWDAASWTARTQALEDAGVVANVAWDFFADVDKQKTYNPVDAQAEIMVWLARVGNAVPLRGSRKIDTAQVSGVTFNLYHRQNFRHHDVFTWLPDDNVTITHFDGDLAPLLTRILDTGLMAPDSWLGLVEFGSETWFSSENVTFSAVGYAVELEHEGGSSKFGVVLLWWACILASFLTLL